MTAKRTTLGRLIERGLEEAIAYERGDDTRARVTRHSLSARDVCIAPPPQYDAERIRLIRSTMGLSQAVFARALNVSDDTVRAWEQGKRSPEGPSRRLLELAERESAVFLGMIDVSHGPGTRADTPDHLPDRAWPHVMPTRQIRGACDPSRETD